VAGQGKGEHPLAGAVVGAAETRIARVVGVALVGMEVRSIGRKEAGRRRTRSGMTKKKRIGMRKKMKKNLKMTPQPRC